MGESIAYARVSTDSGEQLSALRSQPAWLEAQGCEVKFCEAMGKEKKAMTYLAELEARAGTKEPTTARRRRRKA
jgi:hypothetical protein